MPETGLPHGWEVRISNSKNCPYYFNPASRSSQWEPPEGYNPEKLKAYMSNYHGSAGGLNRPGSTSCPKTARELDNSIKIRAIHLLVKHRDSRRPQSWREPKITRSKAEAREILTKYQERIKSGQITLGELAETESDCSSAKKQGDLGYFGKGQLQLEFEQAAMALKPGEMSDIVETESGLHLIQRID